MPKIPRPFRDWTTYPGHGGIDYPEPMRRPIRVGEAGVVDFAGWYSERGGYAKFIRHANGIREGYYHLVDLSGAKNGDRLEAGDIIGFVGSTGFSTGPHLHHEVWVNGAIVRPPRYWEYIDGQRYVGEGSGSGGGSLPFPVPKPEPEEDEEGMNIYTKASDAGQIYEVRNGKKRHLTSAEWAVVQAAYKAAGEAVPYARGTLTKAQLDAIPNV